MLMFNAPPAPDNRDHTKEGLPWGLGIIRHESSVQALTRARNVCKCRAGGGGEQDRAGTSAGGGGEAKRGLV